MTVTRERVREVLSVYIRAWETRDPDLIQTIFTPEATYHERVLGEPMAGVGEIRAYWVSKVVAGQANISCRLAYDPIVDGNRVAVEWVAEFDDLRQGVRKRGKWVAVLVFEHGLFASLREYWASEQVGQLAVSE